jgi:hypothetical protein
MNYYKMHVRSENKLWRNKVLLDDDIIVDGKEIDISDFWDTFTLPQGSIRINCHYLKSTSGDPTPVTRLGATAIAFYVEGIEKISGNGLKWIEMIEPQTQRTYQMMFSDSRVDCVNLSASTYDPWLEDDEIESYHNPLGRNFFTPVLDKKKIPKNLDVFRLKKWGYDDSTMIVTQNIKDQILSYPFDHRYIIFDEVACI